MSKRIIALLCALALLVCALPGLAEEAYTLRVDDEAELLSENEKALLLEDMRPLNAYGEAAFYSTRERGTADVLAERYFDRYFSTERSHSGVVFLIDMYTREVLIFTRGLLEKRVGRAGAYDITDKIYTYASYGDYYTCAKKAFEQVLSLAEGQRSFSPMRVICTLLLSLSLGLIAAYLIVRRASIHAAVKRGSDTLNARADVDMTVSEKRLVKSTKRRRESSSHGGGGFRGGGGGGGGFHGGGGSSGSHRF